MAVLCVIYIIYFLLIFTRDGGKINRCAIGAGSRWRETLWLPYAVV
jgi:hypothetical protein